MSRFRLLDDRDGSNVLGDDVPADHVYLEIYGQPVIGEKRVKDLSPGESTLLRFNLAGEHGVYRCLRVD